MMNYEIINSFIGQEWVYLKNDCWAVFRRAQKLVFNRDIPDIPLPDVSRYGENISIFNEQAKSKRWDRVDLPKPGDAVLFYDRRDNPSHIGLYFEKGMCLHCPGSVQNPGKCMYEKLSNMLKNKLIYRRCEYYRYANN